MSPEQAQEIKSGFNGAFGRWLQGELKRRYQDRLVEGATMIPATYGEEKEREQLFGKASELQNLEQDLPRLLAELVINATKE